MKACRFVLCRPFGEERTCRSDYGQRVFSTTLRRMGIPETTCHPNRPIPARLAPIWTVRAVSLPFCIAGTHAAANAQTTTRLAPAYK